MGFKIVTRIVRRWRSISRIWYINTPPHLRTILDKITMIMDIFSSFTYAQKRMNRQVGVVVACCVAGQW